MLSSLFGATRAAAVVPVFPLNTVLFPGGMLPLRIFEARYIDMASGCLREGKPFGVCLIREGGEVGAPAVPFDVGCLARIVECDVEELGVLKVRVEGTERFRLLSTQVGAQGLIIGQASALMPEPRVTETQGLAECAAFLRKVIPAIGAERFAQPLRYDDATWVGFRLAEILPLRNDVRQKLLEVTDAALRVGVLHRFLREQRLIA